MEANNKISFASEYFNKAYDLHLKGKIDDAIKNYKDIRTRLEKLGHVFVSETDTEIIPHLIADYIKFGWTHIEAVKQTINCLEGSKSFS